MRLHMWVGCRIIGIIEAEQSEDGRSEGNDRLPGVAIHSYDHEGRNGHRSYTEEVHRAGRAGVTSTRPAEERW